MNTKIECKAEVYEEARINIRKIKALQNKIKYFEQGKDKLYLDCDLLGVPRIKLPENIHEEIEVLKIKLKALQDNQTLFHAKHCYVFPEPNNNLKGSLYDRLHEQDMAGQVILALRSHDFINALEKRAIRGDVEGIIDLVINVETANIPEEERELLEQEMFYAGIDKDKVVEEYNSR